MYRLFREHIHHQVPESLLVNGQEDSGFLRTDGALLAIGEAAAVILAVIGIDIDPARFFFDDQRRVDDNRRGDGVPNQSSRARIPFECGTVRFLEHLCNRRVRRCDAVKEFLAETILPADIIL